MARPQRGKWQREALKSALSASDSSIWRGASRVWSVAPTAVYACVTKGWFELSEGGTRAKLTPAGRELAEQLHAEELAR
jgi:hypothetical protein